MTNIEALNKLHAKIVSSNLVENITEQEMIAFCNAKNAIMQIEKVKQEFLDCENENDERGYCGDFEDFQIFHDHIEEIIDIKEIDIKKL